MNFHCSFQTIKRWLYNLVKTLLRRYHLAFAFAGFTALAMAAISWTLETSESYWFWHRYYREDGFSDFFPLCSIFNWSFNTWKLSEVTGKSHWIRPHYIVTLHLSSLSLFLPFLMLLPFEMFTAFGILQYTLLLSSSFVQKQILRTVRQRILQMETMNWLIRIHFQEVVRIKSEEKVSVERGERLIRD